MHTTLPSFDVVATLHTFGLSLPLQGAAAGAFRTTSGPVLKVHSPADGSLLGSTLFLW